MVATLEKTRLKPTRDEAITMIKAAPRISRQSDEVPCPRCGKKLKFEQFGNSYVVECIDTSCIRTGSRGI